MQKRFIFLTLPVFLLFFSQCRQQIHRDVESLQGTWDVTEITGLPSFSYSGGTSVTFSPNTNGRFAISGAFEISGAINLPRIVKNEAQVTFPAMGDFEGASDEDRSQDPLSMLTLMDENGDMLDLRVSAYDGGAGTMTFVYDGAEPKAEDESAVTVVLSRQ